MLYFNLSYKGIGGRWINQHGMWGLNSRSQHHMPWAQMGKTKQANLKRFTNTLCRINYNKATVCGYPRNNSFAHHDDNILRLKHAHRLVYTRRECQCQAQNIDRPRLDRHADSRFIQTALGQHVWRSHPSTCLMMLVFQL